MAASETTGQQQAASRRGFLDLPLELRREVHSHLFFGGKHLVDEQSGRSTNNLYDPTVGKKGGKNRAR